MTRYRVSGEIISGLTKQAVEAQFELLFQSGTIEIEEVQEDNE